MYDLQTLQYLFDIQGYLIVEDVLNSDEVAELNERIDEQELPEPGKVQRFGSAPDGPGFLQWGKSFCSLLDNPTIMDILRFRLGDCFRLDRIYGMYMCEGMPRGGLHSDYGASSPNSHTKPGEYFPFKDNEIHNGFVVVTWNLADTGPDYGGFCCIPGSHKGNYRLPHEIAVEPEQAPCVIIPKAPAGSAILFSEALTHGTAAWNGKHQRRSLLYKYCVSHMAWTSRRVAQPEDIELTDRQKILFHEPADPHRHFPSLF